MDGRKREYFGASLVKGIVAISFYGRSGIGFSRHGEGRGLAPSARGMPAIIQKGVSRAVAAATTGLFSAA